MAKLPTTICLLLGTLAFGDPSPPAGPVPPDKGAVDPGGKFTPAGEAKDHPGAPLTREQTEANLRKQLAVVKDGPDGFRIGPVTCDRKARTVTIPAEVNMQSGVVEYAVVTTAGKVHEAAFTTKARPEQIHYACLLLGMPKLTDRTAAFTPGRPVPAANAVRVDVTWDTNGPPARHPLSRLVVISDRPDSGDPGTPLSDGPWLYNGSIIDQSGLVATREGSIVSLISDGSALVNNTRATAKRDDHHLANPALLPRKGRPVRIVLTLPPAAGP